MIQEIIVYIILIITALHLLNQTFVFFKPSKGHGGGSGCASGGSCSNCSLKIDFNSIELNQQGHTKNSHIEVKPWH